ncbi:MAG: hypothetical protein WC269_00090 [Candidatus Gracilibacteria bacterium]|jgi:hypothetical protein
MDIQLTWDLFVLVFFVIIVAYSLIIGRDNTLKVILGTYVAGFTADALGNLFALNFAGSKFLAEILRMSDFGTETEAIIFVKVLVFVTMVILFAVKGAFSVDVDENSSSTMRMVFSIVYAILSAGLIISIILVFVSGFSFVGAKIASADAALLNLATQSLLIKSIITHSYIWFSLPAVVFLVQSFYKKKGE